MIVWLASYPRSGNTLVRILLNRLYGVESYSVYNDRLFEDRPQVAEVVGHRHAESLAELAQSQQVCVVKTHGLPGDDDYPALYLVRDGRDALVSYAHFVLAFEPDQVPTATRDQGFIATLRHLVLSRDTFGGWGGNAFAWAARTGPTAVVKFEDVVSEPARAVQTALTNLGVRLSPTGGTLPAFEDLQQQFPEFFRRGSVGSWREEMPEDVHSLF